MDKLTAQERNRLLELLSSKDEANYTMAKTIIDQFLLEYPKFKHFSKKVKIVLKNRVKEERQRKLERIAKLVGKYVKVTY